MFAPSHPSIQTPQSWTQLPLLQLPESQIKLEVEDAVRNVLRELHHHRPHQAAQGGQNCGDKDLYRHRVEAADNEDIRIIPIPAV